MAADPLLDALGKFKKDLPDELKKGKTVASISGLEKSINDQDDKYKDQLDKLLKGIAADKKAVGKDKDALQQLEALEKLASKDSDVRLKGEDKSTSPA